MIRKFSQKIIILFAAATMFGQTVFAQDGDAAAGETLFKNNCAQCHSAGTDVVVGPGLSGIETRRDAAWLKKWINNPAAVIGSGDKYATELYEKFNKTQMTAFPGFKDADVKNILAYVKSAGAPVAAAGDAGATTAKPETGGGKFFNIILVSLLVIMALVLVALLAVLRLLSKHTSGEGLAGSSSNADEIKNGLRNLWANNTIKTAIVWLFIILVTKATLDGLFKIGVHQGYAPAQPINFSHKLHAGDMAINCAYCHTGVYKGKQAGIPSSSICMNCHNTIKRESPEIQKIYKAIETNTPVEWVRVHNLPDLAYFNHSQHTNVGGLDCANCHGEINKMEHVEQRTSLTMGWCIDCHKKTDVNSKGNAYYDKLVAAHNAKDPNEAMKVKDMGGLECAKCHY